MEDGVSEREKRTYDSIAQNVGVDVSTVWRTVKLFQETGSVEKLPYPKEKAYRDLTDAAKFVLLREVLEHPGIYLNEVQDELLCATGVEISISTICRFLNQSASVDKK